MREDDWKKLCRNVYEKNCILLLGPEFPIELVSGNKESTISKLLSNKIKEEIRSFDRLPNSLLGQLDYRELAQLAGDYINYKEVDRKISREDLETLLSDYFNEVKSDIKSDYFTKLASLPFTFIVNTGYTNFFQDQLIQLDKMPDSSYYNFRGNKVDLVQSSAGDSLGTELHPFVYNLFGCIDNPCSMVISENDLIQFVINIISRNPGLPANVRSELANQQKSFLFIGFGFLSKSWYFRILLQALESNNKAKMSYALECVNNIQNDQDPTFLFFRDELKVSLYYFDQKKFIETLVERYNKYYGSVPISQPSDAPTAFISYKSEDYERVNEICQRLKKQGIDVWIDKERLQGKWEASIASQISNSDAFILMQSRQVKNSPINYVNVEIKEALNRSRYYASDADFIFPSYIDTKESIITDYPSLLSINSYDLTQPDKIDQLAKDIKRSYERNKRKRAA